MSSARPAEEASSRARPAGGHCRGPARGALLQLLLAATLALARPAHALPPWARDLDRAASTDPALIAHLDAALPEELGFRVEGPLAADLHSPDAHPIAWASRVVTLDSRRRDEAVRRVTDAAGGQVVHLPAPFDGAYPGILLALPDTGGRSRVLVQVLTLGENRWVMWAHRSGFAARPEPHAAAELRYARALAAHLAQSAAGAAPRAADFGADTALDLVPPHPGWTIPGFDNYKRVLAEHRTLMLDRASGTSVLDTLLTPGLEDWLMRTRPATLVPNRETALFEGELAEFMAAGGDLGAIVRLDAPRLARLAPSTYLYAVDRYWRIRAVPKVSRAEAERHLRETGRPLARPNHSFLFPDTPLRCAGEITIVTSPASPAGASTIRAANVDSGHYFFSNLIPDARENIARGDRHFPALGHLVAALRAAGIPLDGLRLGKY